MSDIECRLDIAEWFNLFPPEWYGNNILEVYLSGVHIQYVRTVDLCENWVEYYIDDTSGIRLMEICGEAVCDRSYGRVTLKIRRK